MTSEKQTDAAVKRQGKACDAVTPVMLKIKLSVSVTPAATKLPVEAAISTDPF